MDNDDKAHLITRRRGLALLGSSGAGLMLAGGAGRAASALARSRLWRPRG